MTPWIPKQFGLWLWKVSFFLLPTLAPSCTKWLCFMICSDLCYQPSWCPVLIDSAGTRRIVLLPILDIQWTPAACDWFIATLNQSFLQPGTTCRISSISQAEQMADVIFHMPFTGYLTQQPLLAAINTERNIHDTSNPSIRPQTDVPRAPLMFQPVTTPLVCQSTNDWLVSSWQSCAAQSRVWWIILCIYSALRSPQQPQTVVHTVWHWPTDMLFFSKSGVASMYVVVH